MGATAAAVAEYFGGTAAAAGTATAAEAAGTMAAGAMATEGAAMAGTAGLAATGGVTAAQAAAGMAATGGAVGAAETLGGKAVDMFGKAATNAAAAGVVSSVLAPKRPDLAPVTPMPDPLAQEQARQKAIAEQLSRGGRMSTILTDPGIGAGKLGG